MWMIWIADLGYLEFLNKLEIAQYYLAYTNEILYFQVKFFDRLGEKLDFADKKKTQGMFT